MLRVRYMIIGILLFTSLAVVSSATYAFGFDGTITPGCTSFRLDGLESFNKDNTGENVERVRIDITDGNGATFFSWTFANSTTSDDEGTGPGNYERHETINYIDHAQGAGVPLANPVTFTWTSLAGNGFDETVDFSTQGNCDTLDTDTGPGTDPGTDPGTAPIVVLPKPRVTPGGGVPLTSFAVVGNLPNPTQAYYAPGQAASGVVLPPGTYWVLGVDVSGQFYKIVLANNYLWVPVGSMQPSYQEPWQGQPLPTEYVQ